MTTLEDIDYILYYSKINSTDNALFRPCDGNYTFFECEYSMLIESWKDIKKKIPLAQAGLYEFTATEKLMFIMFINHAKYGHLIPRNNND